MPDEVDETMEHPGRHPARRVATCAGVAAVASLFGGAIAVSRVEINGSYHDEFRVLLSGVAFVVSLVVWGMAFTIAGRTQRRDQRAFEVVLPRPDREANQQPLQRTGRASRSS